MTNKKELKKKLENNLNNYDLNLELGLIYAKEKNYIKAKFFFKKLILINDNKYEGFLNLSNIYGLLNKLDKSEILLKKYIKKNNYNKFIITSLASVYFNIKDYKKLNSLIIKYIDFDINHLLLFFKSVIYENENKLDKQIEYLRMTIIAEDKFWEAYEKLFNIYEKTNKINNFLNIINDAKKIFNNNVKLNYYYALCLFRENKIELSLNELKLKNVEDELLRLNNTNYLVNFYDLLSKIYTKNNDYTLSLKYSIKRNSISINSRNNQRE